MARSIVQRREIEPAFLQRREVFIDEHSALEVSFGENILQGFSGHGARPNVQRVYD